MSRLVPALPPGRLGLAVAIAGPADLPYVFEPPAEVAQPAGQRSHPLAKVRTWEGLKGATWVMNFSAGSQSETLVAWLRNNGLAVPRKIVKCASC